MASPASLDRCVEVAGTVRLGRFLRKILRWHSYTKVTFEGLRWVTLTREQWAAELTLSLKQVKTDLKKLEDEGLIVREQHKFRGKTSLFLRPTEKCVVAVFLGAGGSTQEGPNGSTQVVPNGSTLQTLSNKHGEETKSASGFAVAAPEPGEDDKASGKVIPLFPDQGGSSMKAEEIAAKFAAAKSVPINTLKPDKIETLLEVLRRYFAAKGKTPPAATQKLRGQLKHLMNKWPQGEAPKLLENALQNWGELVYLAEKDHGAFKSPDVPQVGYLLRFAHVAQDLLAQGSKAKVMSKVPATVQPVAHKAPPPVSEEPKTYKKATLEEILALDAELAKAS